MPMFEDDPKLSLAFLKAMQDKGKTIPSYPFGVEPDIEELTQSVYSKIGTWCSANLGKKGTPSRQGKWMFGYNHQGKVVFYFKLEEDAAFFKLTWG